MLGVLMTAFWPKVIGLLRVIAASPVMVDAMLVFEGKSTEPPTKLVVPLVRISVRPLNVAPMLSGFGLIHLHKPQCVKQAMM